MVCVLSLWLGTKDITFTDTIRVLFHDDSSADAALIHYRVPRTLIGVLVGVALGLSGTVAQALTRNPLADPGLLGVTMGASAAVVTAIAFLGVSALTGYVWFAVVGAAGAAVLVFVLGSAGRSASPERLVLAGAAISAVLTAYVSMVLLLKPQAFNQFRFWDVGSLAGRSMDTVIRIAPFVLVGTVISLALARPLNALALGDDMARSLGAQVGRTRILGAAAIMLLCGAATAAAGPVAFIALVIAHVVRILIGPDLRWLLPYAAVLTPILLLLSDILGRIVIAPSELSVGLVTALIGAPVFIALCRRRRLAEL